MFSDGVFAIAITILILNIHFPETDNEHLGQALRDLSPNILAYVLSFILIGLYWIAHHTSFHAIHKVDGVFLWMNMLLLLFVSFMPFPAYLLGKYPLQGPENQKNRSFWAKMKSIQSTLNVQNVTLQQEFTNPPPSPCIGGLLCFNTDQSSSKRTPQPSTNRGDG